MSSVAHARTGFSALAGTSLVSPFAAAKAAFAWWADRQELARSRRALLTLDDRMLRDIGVDRATARNEGDKGFWR